MIAALYSLSPSGVYPDRAIVGIPEFAIDFRFSLDQVEEFFDSEATAARNAQLIALVEASAPVPKPSEDGGAPSGPLPLPSPAGQINTGVAAELAVAHALSSVGWAVAYRGNQPFGYDLEAHRGGEVLRVEVKSSVSFVHPQLTRSEWEAAQQYGEEFVLAVVDFVQSEEPAIWYVRNPAVATTPTEISNVNYRLPRAELISIKTEAELL